ncbi:MAG: hypothetical protein WCZ87_00195 [Thiohalobacteraceae bacterium]
MPDQTLPNDEPDCQPYLYIDGQNIIVRNIWGMIGCVFPFLLFWGGFFLCGLLGW